MYDKAMEYSEKGGVTKYIDVITSDKNCISGVVAACSGTWQDIVDAAKKINFITRFCRFLLLSF